MPLEVNPNWPRLDRYRILAPLGAGGMAEVFLAVQRTGSFVRPVAIKCLAKSVKDKERYREMFLREAGITAGLSHPGIVRLFDLHVEEEDLDAYMVMEFVPGATLRELYKFRPDVTKPLPVPFTISVLRDVAAALHSAHTFKDAHGAPRAVIHRDVNERNVMLAFDGAAKLLDFGIARQDGLSSNTQTGMVKGTVGYFAPEQLLGKVADARADVWALGVVAWQGLVGRPLYDVKNDLVRLNAEIKKPVTPPSQLNKSVPPALDKVVLRALTQDLKERFQTAELFLKELDKLGITPWSAEQRASLVCEIFAKRREELTRLIDTASAEEGFKIKVATDPFDAAQLREALSGVGLPTEPRTVPGDAMPLGTAPAPTVRGGAPLDAPAAPTEIAAPALRAAVPGVTARSSPAITEPAGLVVARAQPATTTTDPTVPWNSAMLTPSAPTLSSEPKTMPSGFDDIDTVPAPAFVPGEKSQRGAIEDQITAKKKPVSPGPSASPVPMLTEVKRRLPWAFGLALVGAILGWWLSH